MDSIGTHSCFISMMLAFGAIADVSLVAGQTVKDKLAPFPCDVDVCNLFDVPQFCNYDRCLDCDNRKHLCGTRQMPVNCSNFCLEYMTKEFIDHTCPPPWNISNGHVNVSTASNGRHLPGTPLTFECNEGYEILGKHAFICNEKGQWSPETSTPMCTPESTSSQSALITTMAVIIAVFVVLLVVVSITCVCLYSKIKRISANQKTPSRNPSPEYIGTKDEETPLVDNKTTEHIPQNGKEPQQNIANGNGQQQIVVINMADPHPGVQRDTENSDVIAVENTDLKISKETPDIPRREIDSVTDLSHHDKEETTKFPIQEEHVNKTKEKGTSPLAPRNDQNNAVCEESGTPDNKRKMALGDNTFCNSDIATNSQRNVKV